ncbi:iron-containing alcohol dehydrogenase [Desulfogranum japonicum]|uniref:iron-containing alcohol dehydrogenase n=1 Tax=Desulfogranum japonicum TaxID=231447 RepID=UPI0004005108|nr:iron-containing alcohol dehydrogenase [Desulfogranum japonicum]
MHNFVFHNPTKILFGKGTLAQLGSEAAALGKKVLLVSGLKSLKANGVHGKIYNQLESTGLDVLDFPGTLPNASLSHVREGIQLAKRYEIDLIVAAGGGSVIDTGKAIAAGTPAAHDVWKFFLGKKGIKITLPLIAIPTLAASGSDMNTGMVLTNHETGEKLGFGHRFLHPKVSILDPTLTFTVSAEYTAYGAVDCFAHLLEFYLSREEEAPVQIRLMEGLMHNALDACQRCLINGSDYNARADLMWTCSLALNGLTAAGLGKVAFPVHCIEHAMSVKYEFPHGAGLAALLPGYLTYMTKNSAVIRQRLARLQSILFPSQSDDNPSSQHSPSEQFIRSFRQWCRNCNIATDLHSLGIKVEDIQPIALASKKQAKMWRLINLTPDIVEAILQECFV